MKLWKNLLFVFGFIIFIFLILVIGVYIHEVGHINSAKVQNISLKLDKINWKPSLTEWGGGEVNPTSKEDCEKFNSLSIENKQKITHAGVIAELIFKLLLLIIFLIALVFYLLNSKRNKSFKKMLLLFFVISIIIMIIFLLMSNIFTLNPEADWNFLNIPNCFIYN